MFGSLDGTDNGRQRTSKLWLGCNPDVLQSNPEQGIFFLEDFHVLVTDGNYTLTDTTPIGGPATFALDATVADGVGLLDCGSDTAAEGGNLQWDGPVVVPAAGLRIAFETRVKAVDAATGPEFFAGLSDVDTAIISGGAINSGDYVGFYGVNATDKVLIAASEDGGAQTIASSTAHTLVEDTYVKLGILIDGVTDATFYVNGVAIATSTTMDIPAGTPLVPSFVCQSDATTDPVVHIDWFAVGIWGA